MKKLALFAGAAALIAIAFMLFMTNSIMQRKVEAVQIQTPKVSMKENESNNWKFKEAYPHEFHSWLKTKDNKPAKTDVLADNPAVMVIFGDSGMSKSREGTTGHYYGLIGLYEPLRSGLKGASTPTCVACHSSDVPRLIEQYGEDGFFAATKFNMLEETTNPIGCANCHDTKTMGLKVTLPHAIDGIKEMGKDPNNLSQGELRNFVCVQCHSEYYSKKVLVDDKNVSKLVTPLKFFENIEKLEEFYDKKAQKDYTHNLSKTPMLRAQHSEAGMAMNGIHYQRGVSCADCHMPYIKEGGVKYTSHDSKSPVSRIDKTCQNCHRESEQTLMNDITNRKSIYQANVASLEKTLADTHLLVKKALDAGAKVEELTSIHEHLRTSQWRWDYVASARGSFFHAPIESMRLVATGLDHAHKAKEETILLLAKMGITDLSVPDYSSKEKAAAIVGIKHDDLVKKQGAYIKEKVLPALDKAVKEGKLDKRQYEGYKPRFVE